MRVTVCFEGPAPARLVPGSDEARAHLLRAERTEGERSFPLAVDSGAISLRGLPAGACVRYEVALAVNSGALQSLGVRGHDPSEVVVSSRLWLWSPDVRVPDPNVTARFEAPAALSVSLPWRRVNDSAQNAVWRLDATAFTREGYVALSRAPLTTLNVPGGTLELARLDGAPDVSAWLTRSARAVGGLYGTFPSARTQVIALGRGPDDALPGYSDAAVPFAFTSRASGESVMFMVSRDASQESVSSDTTAVHEFVHLGQPVMRDADAWLFEGLATWYEKVLAARAGMITERDAWQWYIGGFGRGRDDRSGRSLADDSATLLTERHVSRVYWAGVAFAMNTDAELRVATRGERSLDHAARALHTRCADRLRTWTADEALALMDEATGRTTFTRWASTHLASAEFPAVETDLARLGVRDVNGAIELDPRAPAVDARAAIFAR